MVSWWMKLSLIRKSAWNDTIFIVAVEHYKDKFNENTLYFITYADLH